MTELQQQIRDLLNQGLWPAEVAARLGKGRSTVRYHMKQLGIGSVRPRNSWPVEQMREWYEKDGLTMRQIGERLGKDSRLVNKVALKHGFATRRTGPERGERHPNWQGGRLLSRSGYVLVYHPGHPHGKGRNKSYVWEHRLVMEHHLGRILDPKEVVHHKNDVKTDNRIENLELFASNAAHLAETLRGKCPRWTEDGIARHAAMIERRFGVEPSVVAADMRQRAQGLPRRRDRKTRELDRRARLLSKKDDSQPKPRARQSAG